MPPAELITHGIVAAKLAEGKHGMVTLPLGLKVELVGNAYGFNIIHPEPNLENGILKTCYGEGELLQLQDGVIARGRKEFL